MSGEVIRAKWGHNLMGLVFLKEEQRRRKFPLFPCKLKGPCTTEKKSPVGTDTVRRLPSTIQEETPHENSVMLALEFQSFSLPNCEKINVCFEATQSVIFCSPSKLIWGPWKVMPIYGRKTIYFCNCINKGDLTKSVLVGFLGNPGFHCIGYNNKSTNSQMGTIFFKIFYN